MKQAKDEMKGCKEMIYVAGTNGGKMPCGGRLTDLTGKTTIILCDNCNRTTK